MKKYSRDKDINQLVKRLLKAGWRYRQGKKHGLLLHGTQKMMCIPSTPSDRRAYSNFTAQARRLREYEN